MNFPFKADHPMPDKIRKNWMTLNGEWDFSFDTMIFDKKIRVPFSWTCPLSGINAPLKKGRAYYRRYVEYKRKDAKLYVIFCGVDYECRVYVNGIFLKDHSGGYSAFEVDVTSVWKDDKRNEIVVEAVDEDHEYQTYGKQSYGNIRGIWQDVFLEERPLIHIEKFRITTKIDGTILVKVITNGLIERLSVQCEDKTYSAQQDYVEFKIQNPVLWNTDSPYLYNCTIIVESGGSKDVINTYFGIREIGVADFDGRKYITLNEKPVYITASLDQSFNPWGFYTMPSSEYAKEEILRAKSLGHNAVRIHVKAEEKRKLCWADRLGLLVIADIPCYWGNPYDIAKEKFERQMYEQLDRDINHPSIIYWVIFNETWGLKTYYGDRNESGTKWEYELDSQEWVRKLYREVKQYDPTRLVEDNSPCNEDHVETDINSWHFYLNGYENVKKECERVSANFKEGSGANYIGRNRMADVPVMNSECGNYWGIDGNAGDSDISWHYKYMMNEFRHADKICGFVFTELKDVVNEFNGFYRIDDAKKYFGYESYNPQMTVCDLHKQDYLGYDFPPMKTVSMREQVDIPLFVSSFFSEHHHKKMKIKWSACLKVTDAFEEYASGEMAVEYHTFGVTELGIVSVEMPEEDCIVTVNLYLMDEEEQIVMSNFLLFDVAGACAGYRMSLNQLHPSGFESVQYVQNGNKLNCIGKGRISLFVDKKNIDLKAQGIEIIFEASSKEKLTKDMHGNEYDAKKIDLDFMKGYVVDRGENPNSFYMTDDEVYPGSIEVLAQGKQLLKQVLPDDPADTRGCLSWHYQSAERLLDEAGSYGYLCRAAIEKELYQLLPDTFEICIYAENGISIFGRKSGHYPVEIDVIEK